MTFPALASPAERSPLGLALDAFEDAERRVSFEAADVVLRAKALGAVDLAGEPWARLVAAVERRNRAFDALCAANAADRDAKPENVPAVRS